MLFSDFRSKLRKCNSRLIVWCGSNPDTFAGIRHKDHMHKDNIMGVSKQWVPRDQSIIGPNGRVKYRCARSVLITLISQGHVDKKKAERIFNMVLDKKHPSIKMKQVYNGGFVR